MRAENVGALARILLSLLLDGRGATHARARSPGVEDQNIVLTLGDAVVAVSEITNDANEVAAIVLHLLRRQSIRLVGPAPVERHDTGRESAVEVRNR